MPKRAFPVGMQVFCELKTGIDGKIMQHAYFWLAGGASQGLLRQSRISSDKTVAAFSR